MQRIIDCPDGKGFQGTVSVPVFDPQGL